MRFVGRTLQLHHADGVGLLPLTIHHIRNTSSSTATLRWGKGLNPLVSGRALALSTANKSGGKFVIINLYQFMAANPAEQKEVWDSIVAWALKHPNDKIIPISDFNSAPADERTGYSLPLSDCLCQADARLLDFCQDTGGDLVSSRCHWWCRGKQSASLDNAVT